MNPVTVFYQHREQGPELVDHQKELKLYQEAYEVIDHYPWAKELELCDTLGEGGGFFFIVGDQDGVYAAFQLTPIEHNKGLLSLKVVSKPGFMRILGRKAVSVDFDCVSIPEAKGHIKTLFEYSIEDLYKKYQK